MTPEEAYYQAAIKLAHMAERHALGSGFYCRYCLGSWRVSTDPHHTAECALLRFQQAERAR